ncbi:hypothetical protein QBC43DRAFT_315536 [Cladorrhinum sp. PSN259]|nr:hypothetical protein QBC43DRAFT_315536 [Cladorrhinum sp. PSN259]
MRFSLFALAATLVPSTFARLRATEVIDLLDGLRREANPLVSTTTLLDLDNLRLLVRLRGPWQDIVTGLTTLTLDTKTVERTIKLRHSSSKSERFTGLDAADISDAFHDYVISQAGLPSTLLGVAALVRNERVVGQTFAPVLKDYRDAFDDLTDTLADRVDDIAKQAIKDDGKVLDESLKAVADAYRNVRDGTGLSLSLSLGLGRGRFPLESGEAEQVEVRAEKVEEPAVAAETPEAEKTPEVPETAKAAEAPEAAKVPEVDQASTAAEAPAKIEEHLKTEETEKKVARGFTA